MGPSRVNKPGASPRPGPAAGFDWRDWLDPRRIGWLPTLLAFVPAVVVAEWLHAPAIAIFVMAGLAIVPLAGLIGESTEALAHRAGPGIGGLLNATFGNAAELIIAAFALFKGLDGVVKASLTGSILGNILLVMGASLLAGGIRFPTQRFNRTAVGSGASLMVLASIGMVIPAVFHQIVGPDHAYEEHGLSLAVCVILMVAYGLNLLFSLVTHQDLFNPADETIADAAAAPADAPTPVHGLGAGHGHGPDAGQAADAGLRKPVVTLLVATAFVAWMSEILVGAVEEASHALGLTEVFVGVVIVAIVGNAAEHSTAVLVAWKNKMDLSVGIAMGSALQIALFVAPVLVFASYLRPQPMDLLFSPLEVVAVILAAILARIVTADGESNWLEGAMLLMIYAIFAVTFFFMPEPARPSRAKAADTPALIAPAEPAPAH